MRSLDEYLSSVDAEFQSKLFSSVEFINDCLRKYGAKNVALAFNGGKDCTALLHLLFHAVEKSTGCRDAHRLCVFYVRPADTFAEVEEFVNECEKRYCLELLRFEGSMKASLAAFQAVRPERRYVFMGTRSTDPGNRATTRVSSTDDDWPPFTLLKPILEWSYRDVWRFIRDLDIPYCSLYDKGFTSLGAKNRSAPNPFLITKNSDGATVYKPAYLLDDVSKERYGRENSL